jgi:TldD protein
MVLKKSDEEMKMLNMKRNRATLLAAVLVASVCMPVLCVLNAQDALKDDDVVMRALSDELARSMGRLQLESLQKPYYVGYSVEDGDSYMVGASFGAIINEGGGPGRSLSVSVRVGDYVLDNTNFSGGFGWGGMGGGFGLDNEYDAFRHEIWLSTDSQYKEAIEGLAQKKAYLENQKVTERPDDFSREEPVVLVEPLRKLEVDKKRWSAIVKKLSAIFREYPEIQSSGAMFMAGAQNRYFVNSEGFNQRTGTVMTGLAVAASTQCEDGMPLSDYYVCGGRDEKDMPGDDEMLAAVRKMADRLTAMRKAAKAEDYTGPVLFEGPAGAAFFHQVFGNNLGAVREREGGYGFSGGLKLNDKIGKMIAPAFISIVDDPTVQEFQGKPLLGTYAVDEDGVRVGNSLSSRTGNCRPCTRRGCPPRR